MQHHEIGRQTLGRHRQGRGHSADHRSCAHGPDPDSGRFSALLILNSRGSAHGYAARIRHAQAPPSNSLFLLQKQIRPLE